MKKFLILFIFVSILFSLKDLSFAESVEDRLQNLEKIVQDLKARIERIEGKGSIIEKIGKGEVDWANGVIKVTGIGSPPPDLKIKAQARPMAKRAAVADCYRNFLEVIEGVKVDSETVVKKMTQSDVIKTRVTGLIKGARELKTRYMSDGTIEVDMVLPLNGTTGLSNIIIPEIVEKKEPPTFSAKKEYTGLIIDATGTGCKPAMSPKILSDDGKEVYGTMNITEGDAIEKGVVGYARSLDEAKSQKDRIGNNPLVVQAKDVKGSFSANPVISTSSAEEIFSSNLDKAFSHCGVVIVLD